MTNDIFAKIAWGNEVDRHGCRQSMLVRDSTGAQQMLFDFEDEMEIDFVFFFFIPISILGEFFGCCRRSLALTHVFSCALSAFIQAE
jgi:hypothetical protein